MENLSDQEQEVIEIPGDESSIDLDTETMREIENASVNAEVETKDEAEEGGGGGGEEGKKKEKREEKEKDTSDDFKDEEIDSDVEDTGESAEDNEKELMNMPPLQSVMSDLGHLKQGRRVMVHSLNVSELGHPGIVETIQQESCEEIKLHFVHPQNNPQDWSGFLLLHFCSTKAAKEAVEKLKTVREDLSVKSDEGAAYANHTMEQWIRDEKGQKRWTDTLLWIKNVADSVTEDQLKEVFFNAEDVVIRKDRDKKKDEKQTKEAFIVYRTKEASTAAAKEYETQAIELDGEILKIYKYHVPFDRMPRGLLKLKERRLTLKYLNLLTEAEEKAKNSSTDGSPETPPPLPDWHSKRLETCKTLIERDDRARKQAGLETPSLDDLRNMSGVKVVTGSDRKEMLMNLGVIDRPRRTYHHDNGRDSSRDNRKRSYDSRSSGRSNVSHGSLLGFPPSLTSLNTSIPPVAMLMQQNLMGNMLLRQQQSAMLGMSSGSGGGDRKILRLDETGSFHIDYERSAGGGGGGGRSGKDYRSSGGGSKKPMNLMDF